MHCSSKCKYKITLESISRLTAFNYLRKQNGSGSNHSIVYILTSRNLPSNPWLSWISRGGPVMSWPSNTARRHWCMQMYCCSVWTIHTRSFLIAHTIPNMSTYLDTSICCSILSNVMNVPLRPTPALQWTTIGLWSGLTLSLNARTNLANVWGGFGTPKSGHVVKWKCWITLFASPCWRKRQRLWKLITITYFLVRPFASRGHLDRSSIKTCPTHSAQHELGDAPIGIMRLVQYSYANVAVIDGMSVDWPIMVTLLSSLLDTPGQHYDRPAVAFPDHSPEIVTRRVQRTLGDDELSRRIVPLIRKRSFEKKNILPEMKNFKFHSRGRNWRWCNRNPPRRPRVATWICYDRTVKYWWNDSSACCTVDRRLCKVDPFLRASTLRTPPRNGNRNRPTSSDNVQKNLLSWSADWMKKGRGNRYRKIIFSN